MSCFDNWCVFMGPYGKLWLVIEFRTRFHCLWSILLFLSIIREAGFITFLLFQEAFQENSDFV